MRFRNPLALVLRALTELHHMSEALDKLTDKISAMETVQEGVVTLLQTIKSDLDAALAGGEPDQDALNALSDRIGADTDKLSAAITANTPVAQETQPVPDDATAPGTPVTDTGMAAA
jgi:hypothetical protein